MVDDDYRRTFNSGSSSCGRPASACTLSTACLQTYRIHRGLPPRPQALAMTSPAVSTYIQLLSSAAKVVPPLRIDATSWRPSPLHSPLILVAFALSVLATRLGNNQQYCVGGRLIVRTLLRCLPNDGIPTNRATRKADRTKQVNMCRCLAEARLHRGLRVTAAVRRRHMCPRGRARRRLSSEGWNARRFASACRGWGSGGTGRFSVARRWDRLFPGTELCGRGAAGARVPPV